ncbi:hypothetical protein AJ80_08326 [Polytolypa hystricis UAMH7299]|uniref:Kinesin-like protein n=1 Tax=Polytolypa hystricis (strain UAMH7299) TaxID=1447883 RepID=A0A2B7X964_POLH7|nr:hypothetical protein AJ80_08326 [Polytolypa hystricis UAMH7299]
MMQRFKVFVRWRPLSSSEAAADEIDRESAQHEDSYLSMTLASRSPTARARSWKSGPSFTRIFEAGDNNKSVFEDVVPPTFPQVLSGGTCNFFAYGHSGSGKSHTIIGYDYENSDEFGLCLSAALQLSGELERLNAELTLDGETGNEGDVLGIGIRMYELRKNTAFDLLNDRRECYVREGPDGRVHIRGETETLEDGKVRVRPIVTRACWIFDDLRRELLVGLKLRATGSSTIHDQSSRTHAVVELEVVTKTLLDARDELIERQSELVPVGKLATDIYLEESLNSFIKTADGKYVVDPNNPPNQKRIDAAEAEKKKFEMRVQEAEDHVIEVLARKRHSCLGGKFVFVDLAGSEYFDEKGTSAVFGPKPTAQERQEARQINSDLLAIKEVIRARALKQARVPFRSAPLTMVLREHFQGSLDSHSAMILTVSPSSGQLAATMNTLKYGNLVGVAGGPVEPSVKKPK